MDSVIARVGEIVIEGTRYLVHETGYIEGDTNAFEQIHLCITNVATGEELSTEELNSALTAEGRTYFLHEYACEHAAWREWR